MKDEIGSDFHWDNECFLKNKGREVPVNYRHFSNGRQALLALISHLEVNTLIVPSYFCYSVIDWLRSQGVCIEFYSCYPRVPPLINNIKDKIEGKCKALLLVDYFGTGLPDIPLNIGIPVIVDYTHSLASGLLGKKYNYCFASIRKSLPTALGGIVWSQTENNLPEQPIVEDLVQKVAKERKRAMLMKKEYIHGNRSIVKNDFRKIYQSTESDISVAPMSGMDSESLNILNHIDIEEISRKKHQNWMYLYSALHQKIDILVPRDTHYTFSFVVMCETREKRDLLQQHLIAERIYPAILWDIPYEQKKKFPLSYSFGNTMLSLHCDYRYDREDMDRVAVVICQYLAKNDHQI